MKETLCPELITAPYIASVKCPTEVFHLALYRIVSPYPSSIEEMVKQKHFLLAFFLTWASTGSVFTVGF